MSKGKSSRQFPPGQNLTLTPANWQTSFSAAQKKTKYAAQKPNKTKKKEQQKQCLYNNGFNFQAGSTQRDCNKNNTKSKWQKQKQVSWSQVMRSAATSEYSMHAAWNLKRDIFLVICATRCKLHVGFVCFLSLFFLCCKITKIYMYGNLDDVL